MFICVSSLLWIDKTNIIYFSLLCSKLTIKLFTCILQLGFQIWMKHYCLCFGRKSIYRLYRRSTEQQSWQQAPLDSKLMRTNVYMPKLKSNIIGQTINMQCMHMWRFLVWCSLNAIATSAYVFYSKFSVQNKKKKTLNDRFLISLLIANGDQWDVQVVHFIKRLGSNSKLQTVPRERLKHKKAWVPLLINQLVNILSVD